MIVSVAGLRGDNSLRVSAKQLLDQVDCSGPHCVHNKETYIEYLAQASICKGSKNWKEPSSMCVCPCTLIYKGVEF